ncbi:hypothetical protein CISIN_1g041363mg, partial [Citrus sinensis]
QCERKVAFNSGKPLGYHASWPLFALTHHLVVCSKTSGVSISEQKSLVSHTGAAEFAKRFRVNNQPSRFLNTYGY